MVTKQARYTCHFSLQDQLSSITTEWQLVELALHAYNKVGVGLYDTLGKDSVGKSIILDHLLLC
jgi:hypothetical protein